MEQPVRIATRDATPTAVVRAATSWDEFPSLWGDLLGEVWAFVRADGLSAGRNVMLYADDVPNVEVGVELEGAFTPRGRVVASALPAGQVAVTEVPGPPAADAIARGHRAVHDWCAAHGHALDGTRWEIYGTRWEIYGHDGDGLEICWRLSASR